jgi:glycosyltransferase involved in cell wall biosynthesis
MIDSLRILVVSQYFAPEMGAPAARFHDFGRLLVERGHRVTVITGFPNNPSGRIPPEYRGRLRMREVIDGIEVLRGWMYASPSLTRFTKSLGFISFAAAASLRTLFGRLRADVVIATSPPPLVAIPAMIAARRLHAPLIFDVRDFWPEAIAASGRLQNTLAIRMLGAVEMAAFRSSEAVTVVNDGKRIRLLERGVPEEKLHVVPNGVDLQTFHRDQVPVTGLLRAHGVDPERFLIVYAGVFNPPQGLDVLLEAAVLLRSHHPEAARRVQFVLVGDGEERRRLSKRRLQEGLTDLVALLPVQARNVVPSLLRAAGAIAVTLRPRHDTHTVPSKIYESLASGRPVLVSADGPTGELVTEANAGLATPASDGEGMVKSILALLDDPTLCEALGENGTKLAAEYDRRQLVDRFEEVLRTAAARGIRR